MPRYGGFADREDAGRALAEALHAYAGRDDVVVLGLPRGGVVVAAAVARALQAPLDVLVVRKLGVPGHEEYAFGAVASAAGEVHRVLHEDVVAQLGLSEATVERVTERETAHCQERERTYRGVRPAVPLSGRTVIVVDDGIATGSTVAAALDLLAARGPSRTVVAVPVAPPEAVKALRGVADEVVALLTPRYFMAVSQAYAEFGQVDDAEVAACLEMADG